MVADYHTPQQILSNFFPKTSHEQLSAAKLNYTVTIGPLSVSIATLKLALFCVVLAHHYCHCADFFCMMLAHCYARALLAMKKVQKRSSTFKDSLLFPQKLRFHHDFFVMDVFDLLPENKVFEM
jgi:hypothetical protein